MKPNATDNNLYEVEIKEIDNVAKKVKIHFKPKHKNYKLHLQGLKFLKTI